MGGLIEEGAYFKDEKAGSQSLRNGAMPIWYFSGYVANLHQGLLLVL
jgi:hypothetical protein